MNDRFKFRWFSKSHNKVFDVVGLEFPNFVIYKDKQGDEVEIALSSDNGELIQSTGFKDADGKLIYENDILVAPNGISDIIQWFYGNYIWNGQAISSFDIGYQGDIWAQESKNMRIVGNIYENKELLEEE